MTRIEFDQQLNKINFQQGENVKRLEDYLLACLAQLEKYKDQVASDELFLDIFEKAKSGPKVPFDPSWKEEYGATNWLNPNGENVSPWDSVVHQLRALATDLIHTRNVRSPEDYQSKRWRFEWDSEGGTRFYNGITPASILGYAATRFEGEYTSRDSEESEVTWIDFTIPFWIGISYE